MGVLGSFVGRHNDFEGYWALGQYALSLERLGQRQLQFDLKNEIAVPSFPSADIAAVYFRSAIFRMMVANAMPPDWFADAGITVSIAVPNKMDCTIEIVSDLGRSYKQHCLIDVRPHDPAVEHRRSEGYGPSNRHRL